MATKVASQTKEQPEVVAERSPIVYAALPLISALPKKQMDKARSLMEEVDLINEQMITLQERKIEILGGKQGKVEIQGELEKIQLAAGLDGLRYGDWAYVSSISPGRKTLDKGLLLENGCPPEAIAASYKEGKPFTTRTFRNLRAPSNEE